MKFQCEMKLPMSRHLDTKSGRSKKLGDTAGRNCGIPTTVRCNTVGNTVSGKSWKLYLPVLLLACVAIVYVGSNASIEGGVLPQAKVLADKVSHFVAKQWRHLGREVRHQMGENTALVYNGYVPPFVVDSSMCPISELNSAANLVPWRLIKTFPGTSQINKTVDYDVCLAVSIGDDGDQPNDEAVPYPLVSRLLDAVIEEVANFRKERGHKTVEDNVQVLVGVDYGSVVCAIVRDTFAELPGMEAKCRTFSELEPNTNFCGKLVVGSSQRFVPQVPKEWDAAVDWQSRRVVDLDCPDRSHEPPALPEKDWRPTIVTGFSSNHMPVGLLMLRSLGRTVRDIKDAGGEVNVSVVVWAMEEFDSLHQSRLECVIAELTEEYGVSAEIRLFNWSAHPSWMKLHQELGHMGGTGEYAWKAIMVHTVLRERGMVLWADAGDRFKDKEGLIETLKVLNSTGFVSTHSKGDVYIWTHKGQLKYFRANVPEILDMGCCEAAIAGFTLKTYRELGRPWYDCSLIRQCIAPDGSDRENHRQDQAALTLLSIFTNHPCQGAHPKLSHHADEKDREGRKLVGAYSTKCYADPF